MEYRVKHKETGTEKVLTHLDVNDMVFGSAGEIIVFDTTQLEPHILIDEE